MKVQNLIFTQIVRLMLFDLVSITGNVLEVI